MLIRKGSHLRVGFALPSHGPDVPKFVGRRHHRMVRGFSGGNLIIGSVMAAVMMGVLLALGMDGAVL